jgi:hypothetical protein
MHLEDGGLLHFSIDALFDTRHDRGTRHNVGIHRTIVTSPVSMFTKEAQAARYKEFKHIFFVCFLIIFMHKGTNK